jgi:GcrA cell cycle regulator
MIVPSWNDDRVEKLTKLHADGLSSAQIAFEFGDLTRNAVIGKIHRLGLAPVEKKKPDAPRAPRNSKNKSSGTIVFRIVEGGFGSRRIIKSVQSEDKAELKCVEVVPLHKTLLELEKGECRYPYGDETITFCGHPAKPGSSYCMSHHGLCCNPAPRNLKGPNYLPTDLAGPILQRRGVRT